MSVSMNQDIRATQAGMCGGHIEVSVTCSNQSPQPIAASAGSFGFQLLAGDGSEYYPLVRIPTGPDMGAPVGMGESFDRTIGFNAPQVTPGQEYMLRCTFLATGEIVENSFQFHPVYFGGPPAPPTAG